MKPVKKIVYRGKTGKPEEVALSEKSFIGGDFNFLDAQAIAKKHLTDTLKTSKLALLVENIKTFEKAIATDFTTIVREAFADEGQSKILSEYLLSLMKKAFDDRFSYHFLRPSSSTGLLPDKNFRDLFQRSFTKEFGENFPLFLQVFFDQHHEIAPYVAYENLTITALEDTYTQIDLKRNPEIPGKGTTSPETDKDGHLDIFLN